MLLLANLLEDCLQACLHGVQNLLNHTCVKIDSRCMLYLGHGRAPEIIEEQVADRCRGPQVLVVEDGRDVIKHEAAREAVPVASHHQSSQK